MRRPGKGAYAGFRISLIAFVVLTGSTFLPWAAFSTFSSTGIEDSDGKAVLVLALLGLAATSYAGAKPKHLSAMRIFIVICATLAARIQLLQSTQSAASGVVIGLAASLTALIAVLASRTGVVCRFGQTPEPLTLPEPQSAPADTPPSVEP